MLLSSEYATCLFNTKESISVKIVTFRYYSNIYVVSVLIVEELADILISGLGNNLD